jgi:ppGpp synthetase/RelA/SpoT-type nucleotidyltranferase
MSQHDYHFIEKQKRSCLMHMTRNEYEYFTKPYKKIIKQVLLEIDFFLEDIKGINVFSITSRIKDYESVLRKKERLNLDIEEIQDIAGIRIVVGVLDEVEVVTRLFKRKEESNDLKIENINDLKKNNGYKARHIIVSFRGNYTRSAFPTRVEVQIATVLQFSFNFLSRVWFYKSQNSYSDKWKNDFIKISKVLQETDHKISELQSQVLDIDSNDFGGNYVSPLSLKIIVASVFNEEITIDESVDLCRMIVDKGLTTNDDVKNFFLSKEINTLREDMLSIDSIEGIFYRNIARDLSKHSFWITLGTQYDYLNKTISKYRDH